MTLPRMYRDLAPWWHLLSAPSDYEEEAGIFVDVLERESARKIRTVLELGSGGGNVASFMKRHFKVTLVDLSPDMLAQSRKLNPGCEHVEGDMRTVRLERTFDAVFIHDAISYMLTEEELTAAMTTAAVHLKTGGVALFVPDETVETFSPGTHTGGNDAADGSGIRYLQWEDVTRGTTARTTYVYAIRAADGSMTVEHEEHVTGLFPRDTWLRCIEKAGLRPGTAPYRHSTFQTAGEMFFGLRL